MCIVHLFEQVTLGRVLKSVVFFKGISIEWVTIRGFNEAFEEDFCTESRYQVFRRVQNHTHAAMLHFYSPTLPDLAVKLFMVTLLSRFDFGIEKQKNLKFFFHIRLGYTVI